MVYTMDSDAGYRKFCTKEGSLRSVACIPKTVALSSYLLFHDLTQRTLIVRRAGLSSIPPQPNPAKPTMVTTGRKHRSVLARAVDSFHLSFKAEYWSNWSKLTLQEASSVPESGSTDLQSLLLRKRCTGSATKPSPCTDQFWLGQRQSRPDCIRDLRTYCGSGTLLVTR